jgi:hypothetical protein
VPAGWQAVQRGSVQIINSGAYLVPHDRQIIDYKSSELGHITAEAHLRE